MNNEVIVTARKLTDYEERLMFMPKFFGQYWHFVENHTYNWMRKLSPENKSQYLSSALDKIEAHYDGGEWDFYELSNGGYFMAPNSREHYRISVQGNYFDGLLSAEAIAVLMTVAFLCGASTVILSSKVSVVCEQGLRSKPDV